MSSGQQTPEAKQDWPAVGTILYLLFGPIIWAGHFLAIYGVQSVACALGAAPPSPVVLGLDGIQITIALVTVAALAGLGAFALLRPQPWNASGQEQLHRFIDLVMMLLALLSVLAIAVAGSVAIVIPTCPALR